MSKKVEVRIFIEYDKVEKKFRNDQTYKGRVYIDSSNLDEGLLNSVYEIVEDTYLNSTLKILLYKIQIIIRQMLNIERVIKIKIYTNNRTIFRTLFTKSELCQNVLEYSFSYSTVKRLTQLLRTKTTPIIVNKKQLFDNPKYNFVLSN